MGLAATVAAGSEGSPLLSLYGQEMDAKSPAAKRPKLREGGGQKHGQGPRKTLASEGQLSCRKQNDSFDCLHPIKG